MIQPGLAAGRFAAACLLGMGLGLWYEFLRPLRPKFTTVSDILFLLGVFAAWLQLSFGICGGDLRLGYSAGLLLGGLASQQLLGGLIQPVFRRFWKILAWPWQIFCLSMKKFLKNAKKMFASAKKWVTIKCNNRRKKRRVSGGPNYGKRKNPPAQYADNISKERTPDQDHRDLRYRVVYGGADHPAFPAE